MTIELFTETQPASALGVSHNPNEVRAGILEGGGGRFKAELENGIKKGASNHVND